MTDGALAQTDELERQTFVLELIETRADDDERVVNASLSSELPVRRGLGDEVLVHSADSVDLGRAQDGLPLLFDHQGGKPIGIVENVRLNGRKLVGRLRFGKSALAHEVWEDVRAGILKFISIGYAIHRAEPSKGDVLRITRWEPCEASVVGVPADHTVGINRKRRNKKMTSATDTQLETSPSGDVGKVQSERNRVSEILALGQRHDLVDAAEKAIRDGMPLEKFRTAALDKIDERSGAPLDNGTPVNDAHLQRSMANYSIGRVVSALIEGDWSQAGLEREISQELKRNQTRAPQGIYVPTAALATRATLTSSNAGSLIGTEHLSGQFIETLKNQAAVLDLGATVLSGLSMDVSIPRMTAGTAAEWVAEDAAASESTPTFDSVSLAPKGLSALISYSRKMLVQSHPGIEELMRTDLRREIAIALDAAAINGSGAGNVPEGILNTTGVGAVAIGTNGGAPTWDAVVDLAKEVDVDNALSGNLAYLTNAATVAKLRKTARQISGVEGNFILGDDVERLAGYRLGVSNNVPSNLTKGTGSNLSAMIFGNWRDLLIGEFGILDLIVDPYTNADKGRVRIAAHAFFDISVRHPQSFAAVTDIDTA
jgi:HK97 family phage major capsid protein/HK97 family phage prohead protease